MRPDKRKYMRSTLPQLAKSGKAMLNFEQVAGEQGFWRGIHVEMGEPDGFASQSAKGAYAAQKNAPMGLSDPFRVAP